MRILNVLPVLVFSSLLLAENAKQPVSSQPGLREFEVNLKRYMELRDSSIKSVPKLDKQANPAAVIAHEQALASVIHKARANAKPGDIITPEAKQYFQSLTRGQAASRPAVKDTLKEGNPPLEEEGSDVKLQINGSYPSAAPRSSMPASLLARYPKLPKELEYRFIGRTLVLVDAAANLIIDYAPEVGPSL